MVSPSRPVTATHRLVWLWFVAGAGCGLSLSVFAFAVACVLGLGLAVAAVGRYRVDAFGLFAVGVVAGTAAHMTLSLVVGLMADAESGCASSGYRGSGQVACLG